MIFHSIFREQAVANRQRQEPLDDRLQITAPHEWLLVAGLGVMLAALLVYGLVGSVEHSLSYDAVLVRPGERHAVTAPAAGTVVEVLAEVGDTVEPGQAIARLRTAADQQWEAAAARLAQSLAQNEGPEDAASVELLRLLLAATDAGPGGSAVSGRDVVSLVGGEVMSLDLRPGRPVTAGAPVAIVRSQSPGPLEALALAPPDDAAGLEVGMEAQVRLARGDPDQEAFQARVVDISSQPAPAPEWLAALGLPAGEGGARLLRVSLVGDTPGPAVADGDAGSLRVALGRSSFLRLLAPRSGD